MAKTFPLYSEPRDTERERNSKNVCRLSKIDSSRIDTKDFVAALLDIFHPRPSPVSKLPWTMIVCIM